MYETHGKIKGVCPYCKHPIQGASHAGLCPFCRGKCRLSGREKLRILKNGVPVFAPRYYDGEIREAFMDFKFYGYKAYAENFGLDMFTSVINSDYLDFEIFKYTTAIVPVPIANGREMYRGYNQSELLAKEFAKHYNSFFHNKIEPCNMLLKKVCFKANSLTGFSSPKAKPDNVEELYQERRARNAGQFQYFGLSPTYSPYHTILIDDIMTTGATLEEASDTLLNNGAKSVICCVYAFSPLSLDKRRELFLDDFPVKEVT